MELPTEFWATAYQRTRNEDAIASAVGHIVLTFNRLERQVGDCLAALLGANHSSTKTVLNAALGLRQRVDVLAALLLEAERPEHEIALLNHCVRTLGSLEDERNRVVHSTWGLGPGDDTKFVRVKENVKGGKGLRVVSHPADVSAMLLLVERMDIFSHLELSELYRVCSGGPTEWRTPAGEELYQRITGQNHEERRAELREFMRQKAEGQRADV